MSPATVGAWLATHGLPGDVRARELGGGVSNVVLAVEAAGGWRAVVKQSLPKLRVADEWLAKRERAITEAEALRWCRTLTPAHVPEVVALDEERCALAVEMAPDGWTDWKRQLLDGDTSVGRASTLGATLGTWHRAGRPPFDDAEAFDQLRVDPYYRTLARRRPAIGSAVGTYVDRMRATRTAMVHGDFSPKNVLVGPAGLWVIDFEVAHLGDPAFDLAFMLNHLMLKTIHVGSALLPAGRAFLDAYGQVDDLAYVLGHVGCLMAARVDGKSPAEYLTDDGRLRARAHGAALLTDPPSTLEDAWPA